ncbi:uncharacterized protein G2W53_026909 [Senna tora]|uniref:Uncharacterized protein n=1 Tax=Senna tora TaxID=362788 RepID=A0A834TI20_9FABA|nr:uncharacterized protein G2W53_026909 [Senna tora]
MPGQNEAHDIGRPPKKFQGNLTCARPNVRRTTTWIAVDRRCSNIISHGKPPKKFQGNPTCARPNLRWTTTWIAVDQ